MGKKQKATAQDIRDQTYKEPIEEKKEEEVFEEVKTKKSIKTMFKKKNIHVIIFDKGNYFDEDTLIGVKDREAKGNLRFAKRGIATGKIDSGFVRVNKKGTRLTLAYINENKFTFLNFDPEFAEKYLIPDILPYASHTVDKFASRVDNASFWEKAGAAIVIAVAMIFYVIGAWFQKEAATTSAAASNSVSNSIGQLIQWLKENAGDLPPIP